MPTVIALTDLSQHAGKEIGTSAWLEIDQDRIDRFAEATRDYQWIHLDADRAASGPFGSTIAHGFLTLSLISSFTSEILRVDGVARTINYGANRLRFITPVRPGDRIRGRMEILRVDDFKEGIKVENRSTVEVDGAERPACIVDGISVHYPVS